MAAVAFALPVVPGKEEMDRDAFEEMRGSRREEYEDARRAAGIKREAVWHQETPQGTLAVVYLEADDFGAAMQAIGTSEAPFDRWFRNTMEQVHGIDLAESAPPPQLIMTPASSRVCSGPRPTKPATGGLGLVGDPGQDRPRVGDHRPISEL